MMSFHLVFFIVIEVIFHDEIDFIIILYELNLNDVVFYIHMDKKLYDRDVLVIFDS